LAVDSSGGVWVADVLNNRIQQFTLVGANAKVSQTVYYSAAANAAYPGCGEHAEWAGLPCQVQPAAQPAPSAAPQLPVVTIKYNIWDGVESTTETVGSSTRTKKSTFDAAGRTLTSSVTSSVGTSVPTVTNEYSSTTGALVKQSTTVSEKTQSVTSVFNSLGQLTSYTDADGNTSTFKYNLDGQTEEANDGKGSQTYSFDPVTRSLTKLVDTAAGTFTATYDVEGNMLTEGYPNGMTANYTYGTAGEATKLEYVKNTHCTEKCTWFSQTTAPGIYGQMLSQSNTLASANYTYDAAGRLTETQETPAGAGCKVRVYAYDVESNRTSLTSREPGTGGACATTGGTVEGHSYDEANRVIDTGTVYDAFGDVTTLPAADAGGHEVTSAYFASGQLQSQTRNGQTLTYYLDPTGRIRETVGSGAKSSDVISHYTGSGEAPAWTSELGEKWSRNIVGIGGELVATQSNGETPVLQVHDLQGNIVGTAALSETETKLLTTYNSTEFGVPTNSNPPKYSWGGAGGTATELASGITNSSTASYVPELARSLQTEPITPPGEFPNGTYTGAPYVSNMESWVGESDAAWGSGAAIREASRETAAADAAIDKALEDAVDPRVVAYFSWEVAEEKAYKLKTLNLAGFIADEIGDIAQPVVDHIEKWLINHFGLKAIDDWFESQADKLLTCAEGIRQHGLRAEERWRCRDETHSFALDLSVTIPIIDVKIGIKAEFANFWWKPRVSECTHGRKWCYKIN
jgi:YD repeat-containing protein